MSESDVRDGLSGSLLQVIADAATFEDALEAALRLACEAAGWEYGGAWLAAGDRLRPGPTHDPDDRFAAFAEATADRTVSVGEGLVGHAAESRTVEWAHGTDDVGRAVDGGPTAPPFASAVAIPVVDSRGALLAVLGFFSPEDRARDHAFTEAVHDVVSRLSWLVAPSTSRRAEADEQALLDEMLQTIPVGIVVHDPDHGTERANPAAAEILGVDAETVVHWGADSANWEVYDEAGDPMPLEALPFAVALDEGEPVVDRRLVVARPDGDSVTLSVSAAPVFDDDDEVRRVLVLFSDVSERAAHEAELEDKNRQLESFASVLSHDIRSPLAVATGFLELTQETGDLDYLEKVERSHERIEELIDTLLVLARKGRMIGTLHPVDIDEAAREAWEQTETKDATLEIGDVGSVDADRVRLKQVFSNLFRNSVQHGRADVNVRVVPLDDEPGFAVEDDGDGIPSELRAEMLRPGHESSGGGFGLGLSIVAAVAEGHEWGLRSTESESGGARFEFLTDVSTDE